MPVHEDDHARGDARFSSPPALRNRTQRRSARGRQAVAREDARAERLSANAQQVGPGSGERIARALVAVDTVLFAINDTRLQTYLVELRRGPGRGRWAFPGGLVRRGEMLDDAARRELHESTGLRGTYQEQLFTFGDPSRDPRAHVVSVAYLALIPHPSPSQPPLDKHTHGPSHSLTRFPH